MKKALKVLTIVLAICILSMATAWADYTEGTFTGVGQGRNGEITVEVTFSDTAITDIKVLDNAETPEIGGMAIDTIPAAIIEGQTLAVDAIAGATMTSNGIIEAVSAAVVSAGGDVDALLESKGPTAKAEEVELTTDVVIVGAGGAGLSAAVEASRAGADVIVIEAQAYPGGATAMSGGWLLSSGTEDEAAEHNALTADQLTEEFEIYGTEFHDRDLSAKVNASLNENLDWIVSQAAEHGYEVHKYYEPGYYPLDPEDESSTDYTEVCTMPEEAYTTGGDGYGFWITNTLYEEAKAAGAVFYLNTTATELLSEDGAATGIIASDKTGNTYTIHAKSVILATGGFGANKEMAVKYNGAQSDYLGPVTNTGFGIFAAEAIGAKTAFAYIPPMDEEIIYTDLYNTNGGLVVNENTEVLDENDQPIPNLYAAGEICCVTVLDPPHFASGHNNAWGIFSGRIAGQITAARTAEMDAAA